VRFLAWKENLRNAKVFFAYGKKLENVLYFLKKGTDFACALGSRKGAVRWIE